MHYINGGLSGTAILFLIIALGVDHLSTGRKYDSTYKLGWKGYNLSGVGFHEYPCTVKRKLCDAGRLWLAFGIISTLSQILATVMIILRIRDNTRK